MFERVSILSAGWGTTSLRRSIERPFDLEEHLMTAATLTRPTAPTRVRGHVFFAEPVRPVPAVRPVARAVAQQVRPVRRVRVTRRGRLVLVAASALLLLLVISFGRTGSQAATATGTGPTLQQTTVQQGETLWAVAQRIAPKNDPREVIAQIRRINHLHSSVLRTGQQLLLPVAS
jgi:transposase